jgi:aspartokinase/homoserine dehydrogenase 1
MFRLAEILKEAIDGFRADQEIYVERCGKLLILARELDLQNEFEDDIQNLIPEHLREGSLIS